MPRRRSWPCRRTQRSSTSRSRVTAHSVGQRPRSSPPSRSRWIRGPRSPSRAANSPRPAAVKAGPAGLTLTDWRRAFGRLRDGLPAGIQAVAVAYADWRRAAAPPPEALLAEAIEMGAAALLVDTFDKQGPGLFTTIPRAAVEAWIRTADVAGLPLAVAGRLAPADVAEAFALGARIVGVRSAACDGGRDGRIADARVRTLARLGTTEAARPRP
ncbi:MAG: hypothetical protein EBX35_09030 [Planctomycetia bacterium]|nr:hypothetical protein [Planctomycetia bacterium]